MIRQGILAGAAALAILCGVDTAQAQWTPSRPIDFVVHSGPGAGPDAFGRAFIAAGKTEREHSPCRDNFGSWAWGLSPA